MGSGDGDVRQNGGDPSARAFTRYRLPNGCKPMSSGTSAALCDAEQICRRNDSRTHTQRSVGVARSNTHTGGVGTPAEGVGEGRSDGAPPGQGRGAAQAHIARETESPRRAIGEERAVPGPRRRGAPHSGPRRRCQAASARSRRYRWGSASAPPGARARGLRRYSRHTRAWRFAGCVCGANAVDHVWYRHGGGGSSREDYGGSWPCRILIDGCIT